MRSVLSGHSCRVGTVTDGFTRYSCLSLVKIGVRDTGGSAADWGIMTPVVCTDTYSCDEVAICFGGTVVADPAKGD